jgi:hypothetical protein
MTTTNNTAATQQLIDERLDAIDRALLGLLPRTDRQAIVSQIETRLRELADADGQAPVERQTPNETVTVGVPAASSLLGPASQPIFLTGRHARRPCVKRSWLALSSGIVGIVALALLFATPITYLIVVSVDQLEEVAEVLLGTHIATVALGGMLAVALGIAGLAALNRRAGSLAGHGWAVTGLCTGPLPMFIGGLMALAVGVQLLGTRSVRVAEVNGVPVYSSPSSYPTASPYNETLPVPASPGPSMSVPVANTPTLAEVPVLSSAPTTPVGAAPIGAEPPASFDFNNLPAAYSPTTAVE